MVCIPEEAIQIILEYLVNPLLSEKSSVQDDPSESEQPLVVAQAYQQYGFAKSDKLVDKLPKPEKEIMDAVIGVPSTDWPISKVKVFLIDSSRSNCMLQSIIEKDIKNVVYKSSEGATLTNKLGEGERVSENTSEDVFNQFAFSAVEEATKIKETDLIILEGHISFSLAIEKSAACFYIMTCTASKHIDIFPITIDLAISRLKEPLQQKFSSGWKVSMDVQCLHMLPYAKILSDWRDETLCSNCFYSAAGRNININDYKMPVQVMIPRKTIAGVKRKYDLYGESLGKGASGTVYKAARIGDGKFVAVKEVRTVSHGLTTEVFREISFLTSIHHKNVISLEEAIVDEKICMAYLVLELMDKSLEDHIQGITMKNSTAREFLKQIFEGLECIHALDIVHRDLTPANIMLNLKRCEIKISDFGLARGLITLCKENYSPTGPSYCFMAPELIQNPHVCKPSLDIWAAGCIFIRMLGEEELVYLDGDVCADSIIDRFCIELMEDPNRVILKKGDKILQVLRTMIKSLYKEIQSDGYDLLRKIFVKNEEERITARDALAHKYFRVMQ